MQTGKDYNKTEVLIVGAGPAGLACAIQIKSLSPETEVCVIEKAKKPGNHNLSGAALEAELLFQLLDSAVDGWRESDEAKEIFDKRVNRDNIMFLWGKLLSFNMLPVIKLAKLFGLGFGQLLHKGDYSVSVSKLSAWLSKIAGELGVEVLTGFAASNISWNEGANNVKGIKLVEQGLDKSGQKQPNYVEGEIITADYVILAEGCDGYVTEKFIESAGLTRESNQLYSVGVKEIIKVSSKQYKKFGQGRVVHAMGYPLWYPVIGPGMFGGGIMYAVENEHIAVGMIVGADWKYCDFNPQDALTNFKKHRFVRKFIEGGVVVEAGAKMIPEGGYYAITRDPATGSIGKGNCMLVGDSAGFVNMLKIKGLHNAIASGICAGKAVIEAKKECSETAVIYTNLLEETGVLNEMRKAMNFRQTVAKFGPLQGFGLSIFGELLPKFNVEKDYQVMSLKQYRLKPKEDSDKDTFTARAGTEHREDQPCHLEILDETICKEKCRDMYESPCITFCPAGVYEQIGEELKAANPSNCLHCKTCQRKCPFDNIRWHVPEGEGGPQYKRM